MKQITLNLLLFFVLMPANAQEHPSAPRDTTLTLLRMHDPSALLDRPVFVLPITFALVNTGNEPVTSLYQTLAGVPQSFAWNRPETFDLTAPLKLQMKDAEKDRPWKISLGAAGTAGAFYIAYKHIKKYGFK